MRNYRALPSGSVARARELRRDRTEAEKRLWSALRQTFPRAFRFQVPYHPYFVDFLSFRGKLIVEVDGGTHAETIEYDAARTRFLEAEGYRVMRFWNNDVLENIDGVIAQIGDALSKSLSQRERVSGRSCSQQGLNGAGHRSPETGGAKRRKGEGDRRVRTTQSPSPSHAATRRGPLPLPPGEGL